MGATLTSKKPAATYKSLLQVGTTANQEIETDALHVIEDGVGGDTSLSLAKAGSTIGASFVGNVGIGTDSPDNKLHIKTNGTTAALDVQLFLENEADGGDASIRFGSTYGTDLDYTVGTYNTGDTFRISSGASLSAGTPRLVINSSGYVGIGTDDPIALLQVHDDENTAFDGTNTGGQSALGGTLLVSNQSVSAN